MRYLSLILLLVLLSACAAPVPKPVAIVPVELEEALLARLQQRGGFFSSLEGIAKVKLTSAGKTVSATQVLFAQRPDKFRSEVLSPFGNPVLLIATNGDELSVYAPGEAKFYLGQATPANLQRLLRIPLRLEDLIAILLYDIPLFEYQSSEAVVDGEGTYLLTLRDASDRRQQVRFDRQLQLLGASYWAKGELLLRIDYDRFQSGDSSYPWSMRLEMPQYQSLVSVAFSDVSNNIVIPDERFLLQPPSGVTVSPIPEPDAR